jgi:KUP system potassium uptake protein
MKVETEDIPHVPEEVRLEIRDLGRNVFTLVLRYGFMDEPNIPRALALCRATGFRFNLMETSFFVGREKIVARRVSAWPRYLRSLFVVMHRIALDATEFFRLPPNRVVELGGQIEI